MGKKNVQRYGEPQGWKSYARTLLRLYLLKACLMKLYTLSLFSLSLLLVVSCSESPKTSSESMDEEEMVEADAAPKDDSDVNAMADFKFHKMIANLPSPMETFDMLSSMEGNIMMVELTPLEKAGNLSTMSQKAFGYGVYVTDMGYLAYGQSSQQTLNYFETCRDLAQQLGAGEVFDRSIAQKYKETETDRAQFVTMMNQGFEAIDDYMQDNERFLNATEIFVGSWVESQLIATRMLEGAEMSEDNKDIYEGIYAQKMHASNLMNVLGEVDKEIEPSVYNAVEDLMMFYAGFGSVESLTTDDLSELEQKLMTLKQTLLG